MIGFLLLMAVLFLKGTKIQSVDEYYLTHMEDIQEDSETVTISIRCDTLRKPENWKKLKKQLQDEKYVPEDGVILDEMTCLCSEKGIPVFDYPQTGMPLQSDPDGIQRTGHQRIQYRYDQRDQLSV